jgi:hypothetical protein
LDQEWALGEDCLLIIAQTAKQVNEVDIAVILLLSWALLREHMDGVGATIGWEMVGDNSREGPAPAW